MWKRRTKMVLVRFYFVFQSSLNELFFTTMKLLFLQRESGGFGERMFRVKQKGSAAHTD